MQKLCEFCTKIFLVKKDKFGRPISKQKYCNRLCTNLAYYYRHHEKKKAWQRAYHHRTFERDQFKRRRWFKRWYQGNKDKQKKSVLEDYYRNKSIWVERKYVTYHRKRFLELLPKKCHQCGRNRVKVIHHERYDFPKRPRYRQSNEIVAMYLKWYSQFLKPFCSKICHKKYHRNINKPLVLK